jgi:methionyl-tRNA formyltransferase
MPKMHGLGHSVRGEAHQPEGMQQSDLQTRIAETEKEIKKLQGNLRTCLKAANADTEKFKKGEPNYAFLVLQEHPYGREMLRQLLERGFRPSIVIQENDGKEAPKERAKFEKRIEGNPLAPEIAEQCSAHGVELVEVPQHNLAGCLAHLQRVKPRLIVLGGTRIMRDPVLSYPLDGVINAHPGLLPECRGSASPAWSVYHDIKVGSTAHICEPGIDTGDILAKREVAVKRGYTYNDLCYQTLCLSGTLMTEAVAHYAEHGNFDGIRQKQGESPNPTFLNASDDVIEEVNRKLSEQTYQHYAE